MKINIMKDIHNGFRLIQFHINNSLDSQSDCLPNYLMKQTIISFLSPLQSKHFLNTTGSDDKIRTSLIVVYESLTLEKGYH